MSDLTQEEKFNVYVGKAVRLSTAAGITKTDMFVDRYMPEIRNVGKFAILNNTPTVVGMGRVLVCPYPSAVNYEYTSSFIACTLALWLKTDIS